MDRHPLRDLLSSQYIINLMTLAYADEGDVLALRMTPPSGPNGWDVSVDLDGDHKGSYEFVVIDEVAHRLLILRDKAVESPRSGGPIHDKLALEACSKLRSVGYAVLAWRPYCDDAMPFMDEDGNILPIAECPLIHSLRELSGERLLQEYAQLKKSAICSEVQKIQRSMWGPVVTTDTSNAFEILKKKLRFSHRNVEENVKELSSLYKEVKDLEAANNVGNKDPRMAELLEGMLTKMALSDERRKAEYEKQQASVEEKKAALANALSHKQEVQKRYDDEYASNGQSRRLLEIANDLKGAGDEMEDAKLKRWEAEWIMNAAEKNLLR